MNKFISLSDCVSTFAATMTISVDPDQTAKRCNLLRVFTVESVVNFCPETLIWCGFADRDRYGIFFYFIT